MCFLLKFKGHFEIELCGPNQKLEPYVVHVCFGMSSLTDNLSYNSDSSHVGIIVEELLDGPLVRGG